MSLVARKHGQTAPAPAGRSPAGRGAAPLLAIALLVPLAACQRPVPPSAALNRPDPAPDPATEIDGLPEGVWATRILDGSERQAVLGIFEALPYGEIGPGPAPATDPPIRWSDLDRAVRQGAPRADAAVLRAHLEPASAKTPEQAQRIVYDLMTIDDQPARLVIERRPPPALYTATASVGLLADRTEWAARIVEAVHRELLAFGRVPRLEASGDR